MVEGFRSLWLSLLRVIATCQCPYLNLSTSTCHCLICSIPYLYFYCSLISSILLSRRANSRLPYLYQWTTSDCHTTALTSPVWPSVVPVIAAPCHWWWSPKRSQLSCLKLLAATIRLLRQFNYCHTTIDIAGCANLFPEPSAIDQELCRLHSSPELPSAMLENLGNNPADNRL